MTDIITDEDFRHWTGDQWGELTRVDDECGATRVLAFLGDPGTQIAAGTMPDREFIELPGDAPHTVYGYVQDGAWRVTGNLDGDLPTARLLGAGEWFVEPGPVLLTRIYGHDHYGLFAAVREGFTGLRASGGPVEVRGRLRYIDGCSDTLLSAPPRLGDPCLNLLHFPPGIDQTMHVHPSVRAGIVARGEGICETPNGVYPLVPGVVFSIPAGGRHRFCTSDDELGIVAYHPDSDWGPTDESHPMLTRTLDPDSRAALEHDPDAQVITGR